MAGKKRVVQAGVFPRTVNVNDLDAKLLFELISLGRFSGTFGMSRATMLAQLRLLLLTHEDKIRLSQWQKKERSSCGYFPDVIDG